YYRMRNFTRITKPFERKPHAVDRLSVRWINASGERKHFAITPGDDFQNVVVGASPPGVTPGSNDRVVDLRTTLLKFLDIFRRSSLFVSKAFFKVLELGKTAHHMRNGRALNVQVAKRAQTIKQLLHALAAILDVGVLTDFEQNFENGYQPARCDTQVM